MTDAQMPLKDLVAMSLMPEFTARTVALEKTVRLRALQRARTPEDIATVLMRRIQVGPPGVKAEEWLDENYPIIKTAGGPTRETPLGTLSVVGSNKGGTK